MDWLYMMPLELCCMDGIDLVCTGWSVRLHSVILHLWWFCGIYISILA